MEFDPNRRPNRPLRPPMPPIPPGMKVVGTLFGLIFGGIGISVLVFLWGSPSGEFGSPPLFFRVFGSFIALAFVVFGGAAIFGGLVAKRGKSNDSYFPPQYTDNSSDIQQPANYVCPNCAAPLSNGSDVSPHGDAKCEHCNSWFNIHGR